MKTPTVAEPTEQEEQGNGEELTFSFDEEGMVIYPDGRIKLSAFLASLVVRARVNPAGHCEMMSAVANVESPDAVILSVPVFSPGGQGHRRFRIDTNAPIMFAGSALE